MKAIALYGKADLRPIEIDIPAPRESQMAIKVLACGVCGSDVRMYEHGPTPRYKSPVVLGHELSGEVTAVGPEVEDFQPGDLVTVAPIAPCLQCAPCRSGKDNLCENGEVIGCTVDGGMADMLMISNRMVRAGGVVRVPPGVGFKAAAMAEPLACCLHALRESHIEAGCSVLIIGDGPIGLAFLQLTRLMGAGFVSTVGRRPVRRSLASELGSNEALGADDPALPELLARQFDLVIVATSNPDVPLQAIRAARSGGEVLLFSGYRHGTKFELDLNDLHYRELHLFGSIDATINDFAKAVSLLPQLRMDAVISVSYGLDEVGRAFDAALHDDVAKVVIEPGLAKPGPASTARTERAVLRHR